MKQLTNQVEVEKEKVLDGMVRWAESVCNESLAAYRAGNMSIKDVAIRCSNTWNTVKDNC